MGFNRGDVIHRAEPVVYSVSDVKKGVLCDYCLKRVDEPILDVNNIEVHANQFRNLKRCSQCKMLYFCDKNCQKKAWDSFHKLECARLKNCPLDDHDILIARLYMKLKIEGENGRKCLSETIGNRIRSFEDLIIHGDQDKSDLFLNLLNVSQKKTMIKFFPDLYDKSKATDRDLLNEVFWKCTSNCMEIYDFQMEESAYGVYLSGFFFKHSCDPDALGHFNGKSWIVRMTKDIAHDYIEQISICYFPFWKTKKERQVHLLNELKFDCSCYFCRNGVKEAEANEVLDKAKAESTLVVELSKTYYDFRSEGSVPKQVSLRLPERKMMLEKCKSIVQLQENVLGKYHIYRLRLLNIMLLDLIYFGMFEEGMKVALDLNEIFKFYYGENSFQYGILLGRLGMLSGMLKDLNSCVAYLTKANEIFGITLDEDHSLYLMSKHFLSTKVSCDPDHKCYRKMNSFLF